MNVAILLGLASLIQFGGSLVYVRDTLMGRSKPNRMTFVIWAAGPLIGVGAGMAVGVSFISLLPVLMSGLGPLAIFLASFVNPLAYWKLGSLDYICGLLAMLALILWVIADSPVSAIAFAIVADALASIPTIIKCWKRPETETGIAYVIALCNVSIGLLVAPSHEFSQVAFLIYLCVCDALLVFSVYRSRVQKIFA